MLQIRSDAAYKAPISVTSGATVPFDTVVYSTNESLRLKDNAVQMLVPGMFDTICTVALQNEGTSAVTVSLQAMADGKAIEGAIDTATIAANGTQASLSLPWAIRAIAAGSGTATISWTIVGGAVDIVNAFAEVRRLV